MAPQAGRLHLLTSIFPCHCPEQSRPGPCPPPAAGPRGRRAEAACSVRSGAEAGRRSSGLPRRTPGSSPRASTTSSPPLTAGRRPAARNRCPGRTRTRGARGAPSTFRPSTGRQPGRGSRPSERRACHPSCRVATCGRPPRGLLPTPARALAPRTRPPGLSKAAASRTHWATGPAARHCLTLGEATPARGFPGRGRGPPLRSCWTDCSPAGPGTRKSQGLHTCRSYKLCQQVGGLPLPGPGNSRRPVSGSGEEPGGQPAGRGQGTEGAQSPSFPRPRIRGFQAVRHSASPAHPPPPRPRASLSKSTCLLFRAAVWGPHWGPGLRAGKRPFSTREDS